MPWKTTFAALAIALLGSSLAVSVGFAQDAPAAHQAQQGQGMMGGTNPAPQGRGMMDGNGNMADMTNMMRQMSRMMENCNRMMESADQNSPAPEKPPAGHAPPG